MAPGPITIKLRCTSWKQLEAIYRRDLVRGALFLKSSSPPPIGTPVQIDLVLPTESHLELAGVLARHVGPGELGGRGPGVDIKLNDIPQSSMWMIESALTALRRHGAVDPAAITPAKQGEADTAIDQHHPVVDAEGQLVGALQQELESLRKLNPFQILGVGYGASDEAVRAAFGELTKSYHPDRFARYESQDARKTAAEIFILIRNAYQSLNTAEGRAKIAQALREKRARAKPPPVPEQGKRAATPPPIPGRVQRAAATSPSQPVAAQAESSSGPAPDPAETTPDEVEVTLEASAATGDDSGARSAPAGKYARAEALLDAGRYAEALSIYSLSVKRDPDDQAAQLGLELAEGFKALAEHDRLEAAQRFEAVLEMDPANERAARVLAEMRRRATEERKGHLTRLLGKKG